MTKLITVITLFVVLTTAVFAQNRATIKGKVIDSVNKENLDFATVAVLNLRDSSLLSYTATARGGEFMLHNLPSGIPLKLVISFISYNNYRKIFTLDKGALMDMGSIKLSNKFNSLNEVKITSEVSPIVIKKDTIEFNAEAFKTPPNAVVEELLKRLPGIQVDMDGTISVSGKKIKKLLIDGKQFFANDPRIASKNLDANLIAKIQVYDDRDDDPDHLIPDAKVEKIINLKLKSPIKKSTGGKIHGGYGSRDRFDAGVLYNMFRDTLQISFIGISNNLNKTGFSSSDLNGLGGFGRGGSSALNYGGLNPGGRSGGLETVASSGLNINTDYGKRLKINLLYYYSHVSNIFNINSATQRFFSDTTLSSINTSKYDQVTNKHSISALVEWNPDTLVKIRYQPAVNFNTTDNNSYYTDNTFNNFIPKLNSSINNNTSTNTNFQFQQTFSYYRKLHKKGESLSINHNLNISPGSGNSYSDNNFTSYTTALTSSDLHRLGDNSNKNIDAGLGISYRYPFNKKLTGDISFNQGFNQNNGRLLTYNQNLQTGLYNIYIDSLSRNLIRRQFTETVRPGITYQLNKKTRIVAGVGLQFMQTFNRFNKNVADINRYDTYLLPSISLSVSSISIDYNLSVRQPGINDLLPYTTFYSQLYSTVGNPLLKPTRSHNFNLNYYTYKSERQLNTNIYANITMDENSIFERKTVNSQGTTIESPVNKNGGYSGYFGTSVSKGFKKVGNLQVRLSGWLSGNFRHSFFQVNNNDGFQNTRSISLNQQIFINWNNKVELNPLYNISTSITTYQNVNYNNVSFVTQTFDIPVVIKGVKHMAFETNYSYKYNSQIAPGLQRSSNILNVSVARLFQYRDRGEIKISCYDLLNQAISNYRYVSGNLVSDQQTQVLRRYFLLSYSYRFTSTITKGKK